jgi:hypothetical protein
VFLKAFRWRIMGGEAGRVHRVLDMLPQYRVRENAVAPFRRQQAMITGHRSCCPPAPSPKTDVAERPLLQPGAGPFASRRRARKDREPTVEKTRRGAAARLRSTSCYIIQCTLVPSALVPGASGQTAPPDPSSHAVSGLMALMFRFEMVYAVYLFAVLFIFPLASRSDGNSVLASDPMIWARPLPSALFRRTAQTPVSCSCSRMCSS